jgi:hypothetical protein
MKWGPSTRAFDGRTPGEMWSSIASAEWKNMEAKNKTIDQVSRLAAFFRLGYVYNATILRIRLQCTKPSFVESMMEDPESASDKSLYHHIIIHPTTPCTAFAMRCYGSIASHHRDMTSAHTEIIRFDFHAQAGSLSLAHWFILSRLV